MHLQLTWTGPFSLAPDGPRSLFTCELAAEPGLYIWVAESRDGPRAYYVGETGVTFARRHRAHLNSYRTGSYSIDSAEALREGRIEALYRGFLYSGRARTIRQPEFTRRRPELEAELDRCLGILGVFLAPLRADQRTRRRVETGLLDAIISTKGGLEGFEQEKWSRWPRTPNEAPLLISGHGLPLLGLPNTFEA